MFYDERIEKVKGKISKNAIILSVIISVVLGAIRLANILKNSDNAKYLCFVVLELAIIIGGLICLLIGFIRSKIHFKDERVVTEESNFYNKASTILIIIVSFLFAICLPIVMYIGSSDNYADIGFGNIILVLFFVIGMYVVFGFRRNDIYFNYSIMEAEHYYKKVFRNIGKFALYVLCLLAVSITLFVIFVVTKGIGQINLAKYFLQIIAFYSGIIIEFSLLYLLYSFLEKTSYNSNSLISKSTIITLGITTLLYAIYAFVVLFVDFLNISNEQATKLIISSSFLGTYINFALLIFLTYFNYEYQKHKHNKLLTAACLIIILSEILSVLASQILDSFVVLFMREIMASINISYLFSSATTVLQDITNLASIVGFSLIIIALIKDKIIRKSNLIAIISFVLLGGIGLFLRTQIGYLEINVYHTLAEIAVLLYFCIVVAFIRRKNVLSLK